MQDVLQVLYQGYYPVTNVLIVENGEDDHGSRIKKSNLRQVALAF